MGIQLLHVSLHQRCAWGGFVLGGALSYCLWLQDSPNGMPATSTGSGNGGSEPKAQTSGKSLPGSAFRSLKSMSFKRRPSQGVSSCHLARRFMPWPCSCMPRSTLGGTGSGSPDERPALLVICKACFIT